MLKPRRGGEPIPDAKRNSIWERFYAQFHFAPSSHTFPSIREPSPSVSYSIAEAFDGRPRNGVEVMPRFYETALRVCEAIAGPAGQLIALDWQHVCYYFDPSVHKEEWEISPLPNGDYYIFLSTDLADGWFGHPWEKSICVFGRRALRAVEQDPPWLFRAPIRRDGIRCCPDCFVAVPNYVSSCPACGFHVGRQLPPKHIPRMRLES